jgi:hypothetical protein
MQRLEVGKLYSCSKYLLLYPDRETAAPTAPAGHRDASAAEPASAAFTAAYWTRELGKPVNYCNPLAPLLVLSVKEQYIEVLAGDQKGWIIYRDWLDIKEIISKAA